MVNIIVDYLAPVSRDYRGALGRGAGSTPLRFSPTFLLGNIRPGGAELGK